MWRALFIFGTPPLVKILALVGSLVLAVGCKQGRDCDTAIANAAGMTGNSVAVSNGEKPAKIKAAMLAHCRVDKWSGDVLACYSDGSDNASFVGCIDKLTQDQQDKLMADLAPIISDAPGARGSAVVGSGAAR